MSKPYTHIDPYTLNYAVDSLYLQNCNNRIKLEM
uniref:Uncharacterized protein n=1 Tax=Rhizophora mucronata TaxID=61149 RepID=A0A2P2NHK5_RHIMU